MESWLWDRRRSAESVAAMRVHNADGSIAEMCGNGLRCVAHYLFEQDEKRFSQFDPPSLAVDTGLARSATQFVLSLDGVVQQVEIEMGQPKLLSPAPASLSVGKSELSLTLVSMEIPMRLRFATRPRRIHSFWRRQRNKTAHGDAPTFSPAHQRRVCERAGGAAHLDVVVWERGCGVTQACGTGACCGGGGLFAWTCAAQNAVHRASAGASDGDGCSRLHVGSHAR